ncbi:MAG: ABC transporter permease [Chloroflexi bacterium]|nr:ABC transporter permease [Chloroflexota bacterium]MBV9895084.1 ABC transporter permease [Chloroflexota bacterium]
MSKTLRIMRLTLKEAMSRRMIPAGVALSLVYLVVFGLAFTFAQDKTTAAQAVTGTRGRVLLGVGMATLPLAGLYIVNLLSGVLALFLSVGAVSAEVDSGTLHALLARPMRRSQFLLGRWLAYALMISVYVTVMAGLVLLMASAIGGYVAPDPPRAIGLMILAALFLLTLSLLGSTFLSTLTNGAVAFTLFGLGWLSGVIEVLGGSQNNDAMLTLGTSIAILIPADQLWRAASYYVESASLLVGQSVLGNAVPMLANAPPTPFLVVWGLIYPLLLLGSAVYVFAQRDL